MQMPTYLHKALLLAVLIPPVSFGQFVNFPLQTTYTNASWAHINEDCHPIMQLYSGIVERIDLVNNGTATLSPLNMVNTYKLSAGTNATVVTNGLWIYTNWSFATTNITLTNVFTNFEYQFTDYSGSHSATGVPYYTVGMMSALDTALLSLIPYFVATNKGSGTALGNYLTNKYFDVESAMLPVETKAGLFSRNNIGASFGFSTNANGWTNGGTAYFTRGIDPEFTGALLGTSYSTNGVFSNGWQLSYMDAVDIGDAGVDGYLRPHIVGGYGGKRGYWIYSYIFASEPYWDDATVSASGNYLAEMYKPVIRYQSAGSNAFTNVQFEIWGEYITGIWQVASTPYVETNTMTSTNFQLTNTWVYVSNIVINGTSPNTNDSYVVLYTNRLNTYGSRPYYPSAKDLDERYLVLKQLKYTYYGKSSYGGNRHPNMSHYYIGRRYKTDTALNEFLAYPDWATCVADASNSISASTNWITLTNNTTLHMRDTVTWYTNIFGYNIQLSVNENVDSHPFVTNVYTRCSRISHLYWADTHSDAVYYNFSGSASAPDYAGALFFAVSFSSPTTNIYEDTLLDYWRNPVAGLPSPTNVSGSVQERIQWQNEWMLLFDWSGGLKYK